MEKKIESKCELKGRRPTLFGASGASFEVFEDEYGQLWVSVKTASKIDRVIVSSDKTDFNKSASAHFQVVFVKDLIDEKDD